VYILEMASGRPLFPGSSVVDQLMRIFKILGTPDETSWPGVTQLAEYSKLPAGPGRNIYEPVPLSTMVPKLDEAGIDLLTRLLAYEPDKRLLAEQALQHRYFDDLAAATQ
jgi:cyclin-dependent kinase